MHRTPKAPINNLHPMYLATLWGPWNVRYFIFSDVLKYNSIFSYEVNCYRYFRCEFLKRNTVVFLFRVAYSGSKIIYKSIKLMVTFREFNFERNFRQCQRGWRHCQRKFNNCGVTSISGEDSLEHTLSILNYIQDIHF